MDYETQRIEELQVTLRAFLEKYPKNVTVYQDMCNFELSPTAKGVYRSILDELSALGADDVIFVEMRRMAEAARTKQYQQVTNQVTDKGIKS